MPAAYEIWLQDDGGNKITLLDQFNSVSYTRVVAGFATLQIVIPFFAYVQKVPSIFQPDWRIEVWRSAAEGIPQRREGVFLLRKPRIYTNDDGLRQIELFGRSPLDLLHRREIIQKAGTSYTSKTAAIDDMMKAIVREQMLYGSALDENGTVDNTRAFPQYEFTVQSDKALGPSVSRSFADRNVLDVLKDLRDASIQLALDSSSNKKIYFDMVTLELNNFEIDILDEDGEIILDDAGIAILDETSFETLSPVGFQFQTFADLRGIDRTSLLEFSIENGNLSNADYSKTYEDEINTVIVRGQGQGDSRQIVIVKDNSRVNASRWNRSENTFEASNETTTTGLTNAGKEELGKGVPLEVLNCDFLSIPPGPNNPSSLYGIDWDLGDLVRINYSNMQFNAEIMMVHISLDENGEENIIGRNVIE